MSVDIFAEIGHSPIQVRIEETVTNRVLFHDCGYVNRDPKGIEDELSLQIHLGTLKRGAVGLDSEEELILWGLKCIRSEISDTWIKRLMTGFRGFRRLKDVEGALEDFVASNQTDWRYMPFGLAAIRDRVEGIPSAFRRSLHKSRIF